MRNVNLILVLALLAGTFQLGGCTWLKKHWPKPNAYTHCYRAPMGLDCYTY
jgi:hypothetical protein